jgi:hypothetical protein
LLPIVVVGYSYWYNVDGKEMRLLRSTSFPNAREGRAHCLSYRLLDFHTFPSITLHSFLNLITLDMAQSWLLPCDYDVAGWTTTNTGCHRLAAFSSTAAVTALILQHWCYHRKILMLKRRIAAQIINTTIAIQVLT